MLIISYPTDILIHTQRGGELYDPVFVHTYADRGQIGLLNIAKEPPYYNE